MFSLLFIGRLITLFTLYYVLFTYIMTLLFNGLREGSDLTCSYQNRCIIKL